MATRSSCVGISGGSGRFFFLFADKRFIRNSPLGSSDKGRVSSQPSAKAAWNASCPRLVRIKRVSPSINSDAARPDIGIFSAVVQAIQAGRTRPFPVFFQADGFDFLVFQPNDDFALDIDVLDRGGVPR